MGRKTIPRNQRSIPISFSVKPHLADRIDEFSHQLRFSKSKFLAQAVTEYMTRHIVDPNDRAISSNVEDMNINQRIAVGIAAIQEAIRDEDEINPAILNTLRTAIKQYDEQTTTLEPMEPLTDDQKQQESEIRFGEDFTFVKIQGASLSTYMVAQRDEDGKRIPVGQIVRNNDFARKWNVIVNREIVGMANTLKDAKAYFTEGQPLLGV